MGASFSPSDQGTPSSIYPTFKELNAQARDFARKNAENAFSNLKAEEEKRR